MILYYRLKMIFINIKYWFKGLTFEQMRKARNGRR